MESAIKLEDKKVLIICNSASEANFYAKQHGWEIWQFVSSVDTLVGQVDVVIVYVGMWQYRNDLNRINEIVDEMVREEKAYIPNNVKMQRYEIAKKSTDKVQYNIPKSHPYSKSKLKVR